MKIFIPATISLFCFTNSISLSAQNRAVKTDGFIGIWKGTSLCQVKSSPCHDENVVYHVSKGTTENTYIFQANKIVDGKEEEMGELHFVLDRATQTLTCKMKDKSGRDALWKLKRSGNQMKGSLVLENNTLFRLIEVRRSR